MLPESIIEQYGYEIFELEVKESDRTVERVKTAFQNPSCDSCVNARFFEDMTVGIWLHVEDCAISFPNITEDDFDNCDNEDLAYLCKNWSPNWETFKTSW